MRRGLIDPDAEHRIHVDLVKRLNPEAVLDHYGAENAFEQPNADGSMEIVHSCLLDRVEPHHANGDQNPSASCNTDKGLYVCYSYHDPDPDPRYHGRSGMDMVRLVMKLERRKTASEVADIMGPWLSGATPERDDMQSIWERTFTPLRTEPEPSAPPPRVYSSRVLEPWAYIHPYLAERGIDDETASELQIGYDLDENRITIPHFWRGDLVGWQKRTIPARPGHWPGTRPDQPKYRNSPGFPKSSTLYRLPDSGQSPDVCVVESPFSVIAARALLSGVAVTATFGAKITDEQAEILRDFRTVYVWMDPDEAGRWAERKLVAKLHRHTTVRVVSPDEGKDMGDCVSADEIDAKIADAVPAMFKMIEWEDEDG